jgi:uncharacterized membrane protein
MIEFFASDTGRELLTMYGPLGVFMVIAIAGGIYWLKANEKRLTEAHAVNVAAWEAMAQNTKAMQDQGAAFVQEVRDHSATIRKDIAIVSTKLDTKS